MLGRDRARVQDEPASLAQREGQHVGQEEMRDDTRSRASPRRAAHRLPVA